MIMLAVVAAGQIILGPAGSCVVLAMSGPSQLAFAVLLLAGAIADLTSTRLVGCRGAALEAAGLMACSTTLLVYSATVVDVTAEWITNPALAFGGTAVGCAVRAGQVVRRART